MSVQLYFFANPTINRVIPAKYSRWGQTACSPCSRVGEYTDSGLSLFSFIRRQTEWFYCHFPVIQYRTLKMILWSSRNRFSKNESSWTWCLLASIASHSASAASRCARVPGFD